MINFTGQTKKRVVNLGNRRPSNNSNSKNFLQQSILQRQQREEQRLRDKSGLILQSYIRRYLELSREATSLQGEWIEDGLHSQDLAWDRWLSKFVFLVKWSFPHQSSETIQRLLRVLYTRLQNDQVIASPRTFSSLVQSLIKCLDLVIKSPIDTHTYTSMGQVTEILSMALQSHWPVPTIAFHGLILALSQCLLRYPISGYGLSAVVNLAFDINVLDSLQAFIKFLSVPPSNFSDYQFHKHQLAVVRQVFQSRRIEITDLSNEEKVNLLANTLNIRSFSEEFTPEDYIVIGIILSGISFSIYPSNEEEDEDDGEERATPDLKKLDSDTKLFVDAKTISQLEVLYSSSFIKQGIQHFTDPITMKRNKELSRVALNSFATLLYLVPSMKNKLCMLITITPRSYNWFYDQISENIIYKEFMTYSASKDYLRYEDLIKVYPKEDKEVDRFWKTLFTFQELYSYWLIVSNDFESFNEKLSVAEVTQFLGFLKLLSLTLIFNNGNHQKQEKKLFPKYEKLKEISLALLNQLYQKNLRMKFLPSNYWQLNELNFDIDGMLQIIINEEERRLELDELDSDEEMEDFGNKSLSASNNTLARLEVLKKLPFFFLFNERVKIFQSLIEHDRQRSHADVNAFTLFMDDNTNKLLADIRREFLLEDAFNSFHGVGSKFKHKLSVTFFNEYGQEAGIDGGGITKEFLTSVVTEGFRPNGKFALFKETVSDNQIYPNDEIYKELSRKIEVEKNKERLMYLKFMGSVIGKCFYENVLVDVSFAPFFLSKWCSANNTMKNSINDLSYLDNELFTNLMKLPNMTPEELDSLELNFTMEEKIKGILYKFDLLPPIGESTLVDSSNKLNYIHQVSNFKLNQSLHIQTKFFLEGLFEVINANWLSMFDSFELQMLISGAQNDIKIQDWKENVEYGGFFDDDITVTYFWEIVTEMTPQERFKLVKFVTSVSRAPLLGFGSLNPKFGIRNSGRSIERLPTASTCVNLLKLPDYQDKELMRSKLLYAINTDARFDLS